MALLMVFLVIAMKATSKMISAMEDVGLLSSFSMGPRAVDGLVISSSSVCKRYIKFL